MINTEKETLSERAINQVKISSIRQISNVLLKTNMQKP